VASKKRKPAIEQQEPPSFPPQSYYDNAMPRKRQLRIKDEMKSGLSRGNRTIYRGFKNNRRDQQDFWQI
jgi:hypothetical protein